MVVTIASRASAILYNLLKSMQRKGVFILPANVCHIVPLVFLKARWSIEFVDISSTDYLMDREEVLSRLHHFRNKYAGIVFVRTYGCLLPVEDFFLEIRSLRDDLVIIDDRCLCKPCFTPRPTNADVILYSTGKKKYTNGPSGGFAFLREAIPYVQHSCKWDPASWSQLTNSYKVALAKRERFSYVDSPWLDTSIPEWFFTEYKTMIEARIDTMSPLKNRINQIYREALPLDIQLLPQYQDWRFNIVVSDKEKILKKIFENGLFASSHYASLVGIFSSGRSPNAEHLHSRIINLFNDSYFTPDKATVICDIILSTLRK